MVVSILPYTGFGRNHHRKGPPTIFSKMHLKLSTDSDLVLKLDDENEIASLEGLELPIRIAKINVTINGSGDFNAGELQPS